MADVSNCDRADWAIAALEAFAEQTRQQEDLSNDPQVVVSDLLCNLMHFCDEAGLDFAQALKNATGNHAEELAEEADNDAD